MLKARINLHLYYLYIKQSFYKSSTFCYGLQSNQAFVILLKYTFIEMLTKLEKNQIFNEFCEWLKLQYAMEEAGKNIDSETWLKRYKESLGVLNLDENQIEYRFDIIREVLFKIDVERWNRFYDNNKLTGIFHPPNKFMAGIIDNIPVGTALDIGMGQGRNALFLAQKGWETTGIEASKEGISISLKEAEMQNLKISAIHANYEKCDLGTNQWDLILLLYVPFKNIAGKIIESLSEKGRLIVEAYHKQSRRVGIFGDKVTVDADEVAEAFKSLNVYVYEEKTEISDFSNTKVPIVRLYAGKPHVFGKSFFSRNGKSRRIA